MTEPTHQLPIRIPADIKAWLQREAERNGSSQNSEVIRCIREKMQRAENA